MPRMSAAAATLSYGATAEPNMHLTPHGMCTRHFLCAVASIIALSAVLLPRHGALPYATHTSTSASASTTRPRTLQSSPRSTHSPSLQAPRGTSLLEAPAPRLHRAPHHTIMALPSLRAPPQDLAVRAWPAALAVVLAAVSGCVVAAVRASRVRGLWSVAAVAPEPETAASEGLVAFYDKCSDRCATDPPCDWLLV